MSKAHEQQPADDAADPVGDGGNEDAGLPNPEVPSPERPPPAPDADADSRGRNPDAPRRRGPLAPPPAPRGGDGAAELDRLRAENDRLRKSLEAVRSDDDPAAVRRENDALRRQLADHAARPGTPTAAPAAEAPGDGPVLWEGSLPRDRTAPRVRFWGSENEAEAREQYLTHAGITATEHKAAVARVGDEGESAEAGGDAAPAPKRKSRKR